MSLASICGKIAHGLEWFGAEIGKGFKQLPKIIRLTEDAEQSASTALPLAIAVIEDAGVLATAAAKDGGVFLTAFGSLVSAISTACAEKALNIKDDELVAAAFENFIKQFNAQNVEDVLAAIHKLATDTKALDSTILTSIKKLEQDAKA